MTLAKYFWDLKTSALEETAEVLKDPGHAKFVLRMITLLSRCDQPKTLFSIVPKDRFVRSWPKVRTAWRKRVKHSDARDWWDAIYDQIMAGTQRQKPRAKKGEAPAFLVHVGRQILEARLKSGMSQRQLALSIGMKQPDISRIEEGKKNITLFTLMRLCKVLDIAQIEMQARTIDKKKRGT